MSFTTVIDDKTKKGFQIKTGYDFFDTVYIGENIVDIDGVYLGRGEQDVDGWRWIVIKDNKYVAIEDVSAELFSLLRKKRGTVEKLDENLEKKLMEEELVLATKYGLKVEDEEDEPSEGSDEYINNVSKKLFEPNIR